MKKTEPMIATRLLQCKAIKYSQDPPFQWSSGWKSPIYCDNRITLSYPETRNLIKDSFVAVIKEKFFSTEAIAGVATGAIAHGALVADSMGLPFVYVRPEPKAHGLENLIEGEVQAGQRIVVVEDLISTGRSSIKAVEAVRRAGGQVLGLVAIFTYGFSVAAENFARANCELHTLSDLNALMQASALKGFLSEQQVGVLRTWMSDPASWTGEGAINQQEG
jgi:orotate phosphoribosyltransferase